MTRNTSIAFFAGDVDNFGFAEPVITYLQSLGYRVNTFKQAELTERLLADIEATYGLIWCEWGNGPVVPISHFVKQTPVILRVHRYEVYEEWIAKINWQNISRVIFINKAFAAVPRELWGVDIAAQTRVEIIPNPIPENLPFFDRINNFKIAYVSRFQKDKNPALMLQILHELIKRDNRYHLYMAGSIQDRQLYDYCMHLVKELGLSQHFTYAGVVKPIETWLEDKSIFLSTSIVESQGKAILEAMAMGLKPVIHNGFGAIREIYGNEFTFSTVPEAVDLITGEVFDSTAYRNFALTRFGSSVILPEYQRVVSEIIKTELPEPELNNKSAESTPFFSVCVFTYNRAAFLPKMMQSILGQTFKDFELIIVDDGSDDATAEVVASFTDARIRYYVKPHTNAPDTRNTCLQHARGNFIVWMGSDDIMPANVLQEHYTNLQQYPDVDVSYGNIANIDEQGNILREDTYEDWYGREENLLREMLLANRLPDGSSAVRRSLYEKYTGYSVHFRRTHDYEFWTRVAGNCKVKHIPVTTLQCIWHTGNMSAATVSRDTSFEERSIMGIINSQGLQGLFPEYHWDSNKNHEEKARLFYLLANRFAGLERYNRAIAFADKSDSFQKLAETGPLREYCLVKGKEFIQNHSLAGQRILMVLHHFVPHRFAGVENYVYTLCRELMHFGAEVHVVYPLSGASGKPYIEEDVYEGIQIHRMMVNGLEEFADHVNNESFNGLFIQILERERFDIVHFHHTLSLSFSFIALAKQRKLPVVVTLHDFWYLCLRVHLFRTQEMRLCEGPESAGKCAACFYQDAERKEQLTRFLATRNEAAKAALALADVITAPSKFLADVYRSFGYAGTITIQPLGLHEVTPGERKKHTRPVVGFLGSIQPLKNAGRLIEAFRKVTVQSELHFYANGEEKDLTLLKEQIGADSRMQYKGAYAINEVGEVLSSIDVLVVPSLLENYPLVVREALAAGTPVLASNRGGIPEIIHDGINGLLFDPENVEEMAGLLQQVLEDDELYQRLKRGAKPSGYIADEAVIWADTYKKLRSSQPRISISILCYNNEPLTRACLESLYQHTPLELFEVIAVNNASTDGTEQLLNAYKGSYKNFSVITNTVNAGFARGNNQASQMAAGEYFLMLNNDTVLTENWYQPLLDVLDTDKYVAAVGPKLLYPDGTIQHAGVGIVFDASLEFPIYPKHVFYGMDASTPAANVARSMQAVTAACLLVRKNVYTEMGGLDERYWNGYEDMDFCFRLKKAGYKIIYNPNSTFIHHESKSGPERFSKARENMQLLHDTWHGKLQFDFIVSAPESVQETMAVVSDYQVGKKASIVIPLFNNLEYTRQCYDSIKRYTTYPHEVVFVDNASSDDTAAYIKNLLLTEPNVKAIFNTENVGFPGAVNAGLKESTGDYLVIANNDILFTPFWLEKLINLAEAHPQIGITGPVSNFVSGVQIQKDAVYDTTEQMYQYAEQLAARQRGKYAIFPRVAFLCVVIKRELFEKIGGLDERFAPGNFEDDDYCLRAQLSGYATAIAQDVFIHHYGSKSFLAQGQDKYQQRLNINKAKFVNKWGADPEEIWLKGVKPKPHTLVIPLMRDVHNELIGRMNNAIEDQEYELAYQYLSKLIKYLENGTVAMPAGQVQPFYTLADKLKQLVAKGNSK